MQARRRPRLLALAALTAAVGALVAAPAPAGARDGVNPITRHLAGLTVSPGLEFRLVTIHFLEAPRTAIAPESTRLAVTANPDTVGLAFPARGRVRPTRLDNFAGERTVLLPGDLIRADEVDLVVTEHLVVPGGKRAKVPVEAASLKAPHDPGPEPAFLLAAMPPTLRWAFTRSIRAREASALINGWADAAGLTATRKSPADLSTGDVIRDRATEYRQALSRLPRAGPGLHQVGYVALLDGTPLVVEVFGKAGDFRARWPELVRALGVEACLLEAREEVLGADMAPSGNPDRFLADVRRLTLELHGEADSTRVPGGGRVYRVKTSQGGMTGLVVDDERVAHVLLLTDPRRRREGGEDTFDPDIVSGRRPQSEFERRFKDRMRDRPPLPGGGERPPFPRRPGEEE